MVASPEYGGWKHYKVTETTTLEPYNSFSNTFTIETEPEAAGICTARITDIKLNITDNLYEKIRSALTGFFGVISHFVDKDGYTELEGKANVEVIIVNVSNHTDITRTTTNAEGKYFVEVEPGAILSKQ